MKTSTQHRIQLGGRRIDFRVVPSATTTQLRVRIGPAGVEVVKPSERDDEDVRSFLRRRQDWVLEQVRRVARLPSIVTPEQRPHGEILFRGEPTLVRIMGTNTRARANSVAHERGEIVIGRGPESRTPPAWSLERWLRKQAREQVLRHLSEVTARLAREPGRVYVMGQRTKWGNCSARNNLSFNWRLILAPDSVLCYIVTHEAVHLVVPDHSAKFWLTVQCLCPEMERAKQWLCRHQSQLTVDLRGLLKEASANSRQIN